MAKLYYACYKPHLCSKCLCEKYFCEDKHYHHSQHPNSLHCPLHWRSFRDQVNICWNHTKPNCNARNRAVSINHINNLYVEIWLYVPENGYWNQIIHSIHSVYCGWKSLSKLVVLIKTLRMILREGRHFFWARHLVLVKSMMFFINTILFIVGKQFWQ